MKTSPKLALFLFLAAAVTALHADTYNYIIVAGAANGDPAAVFNASGTMTGNADPYISSALDLTGITGGAFEYTFTGVAAPGTTDSMTPATDGGIAFNNVVYNASSNAPSIDAYGVLLSMSSGMGTSLAHVYNTDSGFVVDVLDPNEPGAQTPFDVVARLGVSRFSLTPVEEPSSVPEPSTLLLLMTGTAAAAAGIVRRRYTNA